MQVVRKKYQVASIKYQERSTKYEVPACGRQAKYQVGDSSNWMFSAFIVRSTMYQVPSMTFG